MISKYIHHIKKLDFLNKICLLFIAILPIALISGPLLSDSIIIVLCILFFLKLKIENILSSYSSLFLLIFLICLYFFLNHLYFNNIDQNYLKSIFYFRFLLIVPLGLIVFSDLKNISLLMYSIIIINIFIVFDILFQKFFGFNLLGIDAINSYNKGMHLEIGVNKLSDVTRFSGLFGDELIAGGYLSKFFFPSLFFLYFNLEKNEKSKNLKIKKFFIPIYIIIILTGIILSGERTALVVSIITLVSLIIYDFIIRKNFKIFIYFFLLLITLSVIIANNKNFKNRFIKSTLTELYGKDFSLQQYEFNSNLKFNNLSSNKHLSHYLAAIDLGKKNFLVGTGFKNFRNVCDNQKYQCSTHPHNIFLEIFSSLGIIGIILFYTLFIFYYFLFLKNYNNKISFLYFFYVIFVFMFVLPTGSILNNYYAILVFYQLMCLILVLKSRHFKNSYE